eukprot:sb/3470598/
MRCNPLMRASQQRLPSFAVGPAFAKYAGFFSRLQTFQHYFKQINLRYVPRMAEPPVGAVPSYDDDGEAQGIFNAMYDIMLLKNGTLNQHHDREAVEDFLKDILDKDMEDNERRYIEEALPLDNKLKEYSAEKIQAITKKLCRYILQLGREVGKEKRLYETKMKNHENARTTERLQLEDCSWKLKEVQKELSTFKKKSTSIG